jgi:hypothetical protein
MANVSIVYTPTRQLTDPAPEPAGTPIELVLDVAGFEPEYETSTSEAMSKSGKQQASLYYDTTRFTISVVPASIGRAEMEMFLASNMVKEKFTITNPNEDDEIMLVQLVGRGKRTRFSTSMLDTWTYQFTVRKVPTNA